MGPSAIVESCPASPLFDSVARWEFEAVTRQQGHFVDISLKKGQAGQT